MQRNIVKVVNIFAARRYASAVYDVAVCPSVCPSVTSWAFYQVAKHRITQTTHFDTSGTPIAKDLGEIQTESLQRRH